MLGSHTPQKGLSATQCSPVILYNLAADVLCKSVSKGQKSLVLSTNYFSLNTYIAFLGADVQMDAKPPVIFPVQVHPVNG
jgi:hypothetical protein